MSRLIPKQRFELNETPDLLLPMSDGDFNYIKFYLEAETPIKGQNEIENKIVATIKANVSIQTNLPYESIVSTIDEGEIFPNKENLAEIARVYGPILSEYLDNNTEEFKTNSNIIRFMIQISEELGFDGIDLLFNAYVEEILLPGITSEMASGTVNLDHLPDVLYYFNSVFTTSKSTFSPIFDTLSSHRPHADMGSAHVGLQIIYDATRTLLSQERQKEAIQLIGSWQSSIYERLYILLGQGIKGTKEIKPILQEQLLKDVLRELRISTILLSEANKLTK